MMRALRQTALAAAIAAGAGAAGAETWDMPTPYSDSTFHTENIRQFAQDVSEATDGGLEITVHSAGSLYPHSEIKGAVRNRQVPIGEIFMSTLSNENLAYGLDSQPFLATSYEDAARLWEAQEPVITELMAEEGLMPLFSVAWPAQGLYTNGEMQSVDGLSGLRFRAYNATLEEFAQKAGAAPVQVEAVDIPQAFSTGQVEAMITSPTTGANSKAWDYVSTYTPIDAWIPKNIVFVNQRAFDRLPEEQQQALLDAAQKAEERGWEMSKAEAEAKVAEMEEAGMTIAEPSPELMQGLQEIGDEMVQTVRDSGSEEANAILDAYEGSGTGG